MQKRDSEENYELRIMKDEVLPWLVPWAGILPGLVFRLAGEYARCLCGGCRDEAAERMVVMNRREFMGVLGGAAATAAATAGKAGLVLGAAGAPMEYGWQIGPFDRPANGQPILRPDPHATFRDPIARKLVHWEATHVFNPAAIAWR